MKIGVERKEAEDALLKAFIEVSMNRDWQNNFLKKMMERNYNVGDVQQVLSGNMVVDFLSLKDLAIYVLEMYEVTSLPFVNPNRFFTEVEIADIRHFKKASVKKGDEIYPIVFKNMIRKKSDQWTGTINIRDLVSIVEKNGLRYNFATQRNAKFVAHKDSLIKRPNVNPQSVKEIAEHILNKTYIYDSLSFNITDEMDETGNFPEFDFINTIKLKDGSIMGDIVVYSGFIDLIDGMHRVKACEKAMISNPNLDELFTLELFNVNIEKANRFIYQVDKRNPLDKEYRKTINPDSFASGVVKSLNEDSDSYLQGSIATDELLVDKGMAITTTTVLIDGINALWDIKNRIEADDLARKLKFGFNTVVRVYPELLLKENIKPKNSRKVIDHPNMFIYYLALFNIAFNKYQTNSDIEDFIQYTLDVINFDDMEFWRYMLNLSSTRVFNKNIEAFNELVGGIDNE